MQTISEPVPFAPPFRSDYAWPEYLSWLAFANAGMLHRGNVACFAHAIEHLPAGTSILEIGSFCGLSTNVITYLKEQFDRRAPFFTCDRWSFEGAEKGGMLGDSRFVSRGEYREYVRTCFIRNTRLFSRFKSPHTVELSSGEFFTAWTDAENVVDVHGRLVQLGGELGFCHIDGNHTYQCARHDFENYHRHLVRGGFILFDDSADGTGWDVCRVVQEVLASGDYELVAKNPNYFFRKR